MHDLEIVAVVVKQYRLIAHARLFDAHFRKRRSPCHRPLVRPVLLSKTMIENVRLSFGSVPASAVSIDSRYAFTSNSNCSNFSDLFTGPFSCFKIISIPVLLNRLWQHAEARRNSRAVSPLSHEVSLKGEDLCVRLRFSRSVAFRQDLLRIRISDQSAVLTPCRTVSAADTRIAEPGGLGYLRKKITKVISENRTFDPVSAFFSFLIILERRGHILKKS